MHPVVARSVTPVTLVVAALLCLLLMIGYFLRISYQHAIFAAESETRNLVGVLESRLTSEFSRVDGMLTFIVREVQSEPFHGRSAAVSAAKTQHLVRMVTTFPELAGLFAFDADGTMQMTSDPGVKPFSVADRLHFQTLRDHPKTSVVFTEPLMSRATGKLSLIQSRSIRDGSGRFLGIVSALLDIDTFSDLFRSIDVGQNGVVLLRRSDNFKLVVRIPRSNEGDFNQPLPANNPIRQRIELGDRHGTLTYVASTDGLRRIASFSRLDDRFPFYVQVAFAEDYYLAAWRNQVLWIGLLVVPLLLAFAVALVRINSNKKAEVLLQKELWDRSHRLNNIIEGTNTGTWEWNVQSGEALVNERWAEIIGYTLEELSPISVETWMKHCHPDDLKHSIELLEKHFAKELAYYECEARIRHKDGHWVWVLDRGKVTSWTEDGKPLLMSGTHQDITSQKDDEQQLIEARQQAEAANVAKSCFLATMSHEIRTPMNGILGMAQLLLMPNLTDNERHVYAKTILSSGHLLLTLLNDILDLSKIEAGKFQLDSIVFKPISILRETYMLFSGTAQAKGLQLEYQWKGLPSCSYLSDATRIRQMLSNLVGNAIKFTREGRVHMEGVLIEQDGESALLEFSVSDTGMGIPPEKIDLLFKPFSQTDNSITREFGGSGLGLSIVRHLAKMMGGDVGVESVAGKGSRFWFRLRAKPVAQENISAERPANDVTESALLSGRVLVVEDNVVNRMVIESMLTKLGVSVTLAFDGQQALDTITQGDCSDLVLMDLHMPVMDGYGATDQIRQWERGNNRPRLTIIALTADAYQEDRQRCLAVGMDDFLTKPIALDALKSTLNKWLPMPNR